LQKYNFFTEHLNFDIETFIKKHINDNKNTLAFKLKANKQTNYNANLVLETLINYKKALYKVPIYALNYCWLPTKSYEQCSSELTSFYKSSLYKGDKVLDLSGGLGIDDIAFAKKFNEVISIDCDEELNEIVKYNFNKLGIKNIERVTAFAEDFLQKNNTNFDLVYIDADRRPSGNNKNFLFEDCTPNILEIIPPLKQISNQLLIKLSPLIDLNYCIKSINNIEEIHVVSLKNEVKEILLKVNFLIESSTKIKAINIINNEEIQLFEEVESHIEQNIEFSEATYFFEPNASIIKARLSFKYSQSLGLKMLAENSNFFIGNNNIENFMGRSFKIKQSMVFSKQEFINYLKQNNISKANISKRNFPINETEIAKQFNIKNGGEDYFFFTKNNQDQKLVFHCVKN
jgi:hypothetical protein